MKAWSDESSCAIGWWSWRARPRRDRRTVRAVPAVVRGAGDQTLAWDVTTPGGRSRIAIDPVLRLSSLIMVRDAVRVGVGAGRLPVSLVSHDLAAGTLVHWGDVDGPEITLWTLYPSRRLLSARVSALPRLSEGSFSDGYARRAGVLRSGDDREQLHSIRAFPVLSGPDRAADLCFDAFLRPLPNTTRRKMVPIRSAECRT